MNRIMPPKIAFDEQLLEEALTSLELATGMIGQLSTGGNHRDGKVSLHIAGTRLDYTCEVKRNIDRMAVLDDIKARSGTGKNTLLVCTPLTSTMAARCQALEIQFIDTAGNAFLTNGDGILISIAGRKTQKESIAHLDKTVTSAALRMMFAFLAQPSMLNAPYREISSSVYVATGAIGNALKAMETRGFIGTAPGGRRSIAAPESLLSEWATGYISRLRPKMRKFRFTSDNPNALTEQWEPEKRFSAWGGEIAAEIVTQHLNPSTVTIYMNLEHKQELTALVKRFKLRADPHGEIEIVQPFWNMDLFVDEFPTVPLHVIYADLLATQDSRNLMIAKRICEVILNHVHHSEK